MNKDKAQLVKLCTDNFFSHPEWESVIDLINMYIEDLNLVDSIDLSGKTNDEIATELKARQITAKRLKLFIDDSLTLRKIHEGVPKKQRKYK